jgi:hypothetical protein
LDRDERLTRPVNNSRRKPMKRQFLFLALAANVLLLGTSSKAHAWGAAHVGYTHVGPSGVQHYGYTAARGPYGSYSGGHVSDYGYGGASYHAGYGSASYGGYHAYTPAYSGGYAAGGYHYNTYGGGYSAGVYRGW